MSTPTPCPACNRSPQRISKGDGWKAFGCVWCNRVAVDPTWVDAREAWEWQCVNGVPGPGRAVSLKQMAYPDYQKRVWDDMMAGRMTILSPYISRSNPVRVNPDFHETENLAQ